MNWKVGDEVYSIQAYTGVEKGTITKLLEDGAYIKFDKGGTGGAKFQKMFLTKEEAQKYNLDESERFKNEYREQLKTKEDVLRFIFEHCGNFQEYTNHEANEVGIEKVQEMFGVDID